MKKLLLALGFVFGVVGLVSAPTYADSWSRNDREWGSRWNKWRDRGAVLGIKDWNITDKNCETVKVRLSNKLDSLKNAGERKKEKYENIKTRVQAVIDTAKEQGVDTAKLEEDLVVLATKVEVYKAEAIELYDKLQKSASVDCTTEEGRAEMRVWLQEARNQLKEVRSAMKDIHTFLRETLKPDLHDVKGQLETLADNSTDSPEDTTN